jgi:DNA-binding Xre family transcriptional regulator
MELEYYLKDVEHLLNASGVNLMALSRDCGVSYTLLREIKAGKRKNCNISTLSAIYKKLCGPVPDKKCQECKFYDDFDDGAFYCEARGAGSDQEPVACYMHKPK